MKTTFKELKKTKITDYSKHKSQKMKETKKKHQMNKKRKYFWILCNNRLKTPKQEKSKMQNQNNKKMKCFGKNQIMINKCN